MIRTVAALFAKKTAIVAISGATIIGGATFAVAAVGEPPGDDGTCDADEVLVDGLCQADADGDGKADPVDDPDTCDDETTEGIVETCPAEDDPDTCDDETAEGIVTTEGIVEECEGLGDEEEVVTEHPDNHGKVVSANARGAMRAPSAPA